MTFPVFGKQFLKVDEYKDATYKMLKFRTFKIRAHDGKFSCPYCEDKKVYEYTPLLQHAVQVADSKDGAKQSANHSAVAGYLVTDLVDEAEPPPESRQPSESGDNSEYLNEWLILKERESNEKLQEARNAVIEYEFSRKSVFIKACKKQYPPWQVHSKAAEICSSWQEKLKNPKWYPFRVVECKGSTQRKVNEDNELLKGLKKEWAGEVHDAVVTALEELNEYNASGCYPVPELWNFM